MGYIREEIPDAARATKTGLREVCPDEALALRTRIVQRYATGAPGAVLWERLHNEASVQDAESWRWIADFVREEEALLFFNDTDDLAMFCCRGGDRIVRLLGECTRCEFYVTNWATEYLLCHKHHDFLIAAGTAVPWLRSRCT